MHHRSHYLPVNGGARTLRDPKGMASLPRALLLFFERLMVLSELHVEVLIVGREFRWMCSNRLCVTSRAPRFQSIGIANRTTF